MSVYVAGKFEEADLVRKIQNGILTNGFGITHDWTYEDMSKAVPGYEEEYRRKCASADLRGVKQARAVVLLPHINMQGAYIEVGAALILEIPVIIYWYDGLSNLDERKAKWDRHIFSSLCQHYDNFGDVISAVTIAHELPHIPLPFAETVPRTSVTNL